MTGQGAIPTLPRIVGRSQMVTSLHPVRCLANRLRALDHESPHSYAVEAFDQVTAGDTWLGPDQVLDAMFASDGPHLSYGPAIVGARLIGSLGYAAAGRLGVAIAVAGQAYDTGPESLMLRLDDEGLVVQAAVRSRGFAVLPDDGLAGDPAVTTVGDLRDLVTWAARGAHATLAPLIETIHRRTRYGTVAMWNQVADSVLGPSTRAPLLAGRNQAAGRATGQLFLDALVAEGAPIRCRGTVGVGQDERGRLVLEPVRGMCCLYYRQGEDKCAGCPLTKTSSREPSRKTGS